MKKKIKHLTQGLHNAVKPLLNPFREKGDFARRTALTWNPLSVDPEASRFSSYAAYNGTSVFRPLASNLSVDGELIEAHEQLRQQILGQQERSFGRRTYWNRVAVPCVFYRIYD